MGVAVIGGLIASTALSLFVVPVLFTITDDLQQKLERLFGRFKTREPDAAPENAAWSSDTAGSSAR